MIRWFMSAALIATAGTNGPEAEVLRFDSAQDWASWQLPAGAINVSPTGGLEPVALRKGMNAVLDAARFGGGVRSASSNETTAALVMDGDRLTGWRPAAADPAGGAFIEIDLGRAVSTFGDYDNDGDLDLFVVSRERPIRIYMNLGDGNFADMARSFGMADTVSAQSLLLGDYDNDGDSDIYLITATAPNRLYRNEGTDNGWLQIRAVGTKSNIDGVAARIEVFAGGQVTMRAVESTDGSSQNSPLVQFGLGGQSRLDSLVLHWPSGRVDVHRRIPANSVVRLVEEGMATAVADDGGAAPRDFSLEQNFPNPFNPRTAIRYRLPRAGRVRLTVYNIAGQLVRHLVDETAQAGQYQVFWEGTDDRGRAVGNGVYLYRLQAGDLSATRSLVLLK